MMVLHNGTSKRVRRDIDATKTGWTMKRTIVLVLVLAIVVGVLLAPYVATLVTLADVVSMVGL